MTGNLLSVKRCEFLKNITCSLLNEACFNIQKKPEMCALRSHYGALQLSKKDPPINAKIKKLVLSEALKRWKDYAKNPSPGKKQMTARPLEDAIAAVLKSNLAQLGVQVEPRKPFEIAEGVKSIIDGLLTKEGHPTTLISVKTWLGAGYLRDSFGDAYFVKMMHGRRNIRYYLVALEFYISKELINLARPYIDGVYCLSTGPFIDDLVKELKSLYA